MLARAPLDEVGRVVAAGVVAYEREVPTLVIPAVVVVPFGASYLHHLTSRTLSLSLLLLCHLAHRTLIT